MYSLNMPVARVRAKMREEFERHRYVNNLSVVDVLIGQSNMEFQVRLRDSQKELRACPSFWKLVRTIEKQSADIGLAQETLNFWKQLTHVMKYFRKEEDPSAALPKNFIGGFLEVRRCSLAVGQSIDEKNRDEIKLFALTVPWQTVHSPDHEAARRHYAGKTARFITTKVPAAVPLKVQTRPSQSRTSQSQYRTPQ